MPILPFTGAAVTDGNDGGADTDTLTIVVGHDSGTLSGPGIDSEGGGTYRLTGTAGQVTAALHQLTFTPAAGQPDTTTTTSLVLLDTSAAGAASSPVTVDVTDIDPPPAPAAPTLAPGSDSGVSNSDDLTNVTEPTFTGGAGAVLSGATVALYDGQMQIGTTTTNTDGSYSVTATTALAQGQNSITVTQSANGLTSAMSPATTVTLDTTAPTITALADGGTGIDPNGNGDLGAGKTVTLTVTTSEPVTVQGGTPTLTLNDGGTATYTGGSGTSSLTFSTTVVAGQNTAKLAVTAVNTNGAAVTDAAGNPISTSLAGASVPSGTLVVDTTAPVASSPTLTVAQNSGPTSIGIAAPSDNLTTAASLVIVAGTLPTDGIVTLANGSTRVTAGESLTAAQLTGLEFTPTPGVSGQGSTFTYTVTDGAGNIAPGTAALNVGAAGAPTIPGTHATTDANEAPVSPFAGVTVADPSSASGAMETLAITLTGGGGTLSEGAGYTGARTLSGGGTSYQLTGTAVAVMAELDALTFTPTAGKPATTSTTTLVLTDTSSTGASVADSGTSVADTAAAAPAPVQSIPDAVSFLPSVTYSKGVFTLTGTASSPAGVRSVEISADVDGVATDLGAATVNANGTFTFSDTVGAHTQGFITATETDNAGGTASSTADYSLTGGRRGGGAEQDTYSADGSAVLLSTRFGANGRRNVGVEAPGQTVDLQPFDIVSDHHQASTSFVFSRGDGLDVIDGFKAAGAGHDTIDLPSSDFTNFADVLRNTGDVNGSAFITDPKTGDAIRLAGVSTAQLKPKDFAFG